MAAHWKALFHHLWMSCSPQFASNCYKSWIFEEDNLHLTTQWLIFLFYPTKVAPRKNDIWQYGWVRRFFALQYLIVMRSLIIKLIFLCPRFLIDLLASITWQQRRLHSDREGPTGSFLTLLISACFNMAILIFIAIWWFNGKLIFCQNERFKRHDYIQCFFCLLCFHFCSSNGHLGASLLPGWL